MLVHLLAQREYKYTGSQIKCVTILGCYFIYDLIIFIAHLMTFLQMGLGLYRAKTGGYKGIRVDKRFKGRGGYPMETSYHFIHQNTKKISWFSIFRESYMK